MQPFSKALFWQNLTVFKVFVNNSSSNLSQFSLGPLYLAGRGEPSAQVQEIHSLYELYLVHFVEQALAPSQ